MKKFEQSARNFHEKIVILDFGGQYAHLIASRIRRERVLAEIWDPGTAIERFRDPKIRGIILSGGPQSVFDADSPKCDPAIFDLKLPVLGICYGHQFLCQSLGGEVSPGRIREYGRAELDFCEKCPLFKSLNPSGVSSVWMSHGDEVSRLPGGFEVAGRTENCAHAVVWNRAKNIFGIQFHPEVTHTREGGAILRNFVKNICNARGDWTIERFLEEESKILLEKIGKKNVFLFVSGGVDSTVAFALLSKILGKNRVRGLFVDTGLLRKNEVDFVEKSLRAIGADLTTLREGEHFFAELAGVVDPEEKRERIGHAFLEVQRRFFQKNDLHEGWILAQGTIYPDTIETGGTKNASKIKTHHNRAPEVQKMIDAGKIIEPLRDLYKDEVRALGERLGLPRELVHRHPFPGPGLGVRCLGASESAEEIPAEKLSAFTLQTNKKPFFVLPIRSVGVQGDARTFRHPAIFKKNTNAIMENGEISIEKAENLATKLINHYSEINRCLVRIGANFVGEIGKIQVKKCGVDPSRIKILQEADFIVSQLLESMNLYEKIWQFPVVLAPVAFNDAGSESVILRPVDSIDAMSASVGRLPLDFFKKVAEQILQNPEISAVLLDVTSKPPGTIEWE